MADLDFLKLQLLNDPETMQKLQTSMIPMQPQVQGIDTLPNSDAEIKKLIRQKFLESQQLQQQEIEQAKNRLAIEQAKQAEAGVLGNLDLRPFAEAARQYGAATAVVPKEAPESNAAMVEKLRQEVIKNQQGISEDQVKFLKTMLDEKNAKSNMQALLSMGNQEMRAFENVQRKFDKPIKEINDFYQSHDAVKSALDSGDIYAIQSSLSNYARMSGEKGVLTDEDIKRVIPVNLQSKFAVWWSKIKSDPTIKAPEGVVEALSSGLGRLRTAAETKARKSLELAKGQASRGPGIYKKYANDIFEEASQSIRSKEAEAGGGLMSPEQKTRLEELKKKYGK